MGWREGGKEERGARERDDRETEREGMRLMLEERWKVDSSDDDLECH